MMDIHGKHADLSIARPDALQKIAHALSSPTRLEILRLLRQHCMNVGEIAAALDIPVSTAALSIKILAEAGIITAESQPGVRGAIKLCSRRLDSVSIDLAPPDAHQATYLTLQMPIGGFSLAEDIQPTCGIAGESGFIGDVDSALSFYVPERFGAQLIWFRSGFLEYRFSVPMMTNLVPEWIEVSFEACSEAPMYRDPWKSDITLKINGMRIGTWCCPCDCGGRRGALTPEWWSELSTQFGFLKTWRVDETGSYLEKERMSDTKLSELRLQEASYFSIRIGVEKNAANVGGINLFGEHFGDYPQPLVVRIGYHIA